MLFNAPIATLHVQCPLLSSSYIVQIVQINAVLGPYIATLHVQL